MSNDDRRRILELLSRGKISTDEAEQLLNAAAGSEPSAAEKPQPRYLRINVHRPAGPHHGDKDVDIRVPLAIVRSGMRLGAIIPGLAGDRVSARLRERGVDLDLSKIDASTIESMVSNLGEMNIDIDSGRAQVRITCE